MEAISLYELNAKVRQTLKQGFPYPVWITAEITELQLNRSGHCYMQLAEKREGDDAVVATARATVWAYLFQTLRPYFEEETGRSLAKGMRVMLQVEVVFHELYGYSLNVKDIDPTYTVGDLERKKKEILEHLRQDGVIDMNREKELPLLPKHIAVISSPTAAGLGDFMNHLENNSGNYRFHVKLFPAVMQGDKCPQSVISALFRINDYADLFDVAVIIRGGGAQTDLSCFDDYDLACCIANFPLPVISGIGHERDETIVDRVACLRVKTPTAAAAWLVERFQLQENEQERLKHVFADGVGDLLEEEYARQLRASSGLRHAAQYILSENAGRLSLLAHQAGNGGRLFFQKQTALLEQAVNRMDRRCLLKTEGERLRLHRNIASLRQKTAALLAGIEKRLEVASAVVKYADPKTVLRRGFSITRLGGKALTDPSVLKPGDVLETETLAGKIRSEVVESESKQE